MEHTDTKKMEPREVVKGVHGKFVHSPHMTMAWWVIEQGAALPEHSHEHEQVVNVVKNGMAPAEMLEALMSRPVREEQGQEI